ncbi:MAG: YlxR family protein [Ardenticatenaceae bacterium]|nr:YlxR family protein [Anaerolineales bacterium]MCB8938348.1 YlxR family protein [Ardenticatenaceae bacterium]MCB8975345.1 YlxR family protein [Ardenticatenaceae bacterium]
MSKKKKQPARPKHVPQRTCFVCREKRDKRQLTRLVRTPEGPVLVDPTGKQNGRGAYLCDDPVCWDKVLRNGRLLNQALKTELTAENLAAIAIHRPAVALQIEPK